MQTSGADVFEFNPNEAQKQSYSAPSLVEYGSVTALTQEFSTMGLIVVASVTATVLGPIRL